MHVNQPKHIDHSNFLSAASKLSAPGKVSVKFSIPKSPFKINGDSLGWVEGVISKLSASFGKRLMDSIQSNSLFKVAGAGPNTFGMHPFTENGQDFHPQLNFVQDHNQDLNLASVNVKINNGPYQQWGAAPDAAHLAPPPQAQPSAPRPTLPQRPPVGIGLTSVGLGLGNHQAFKNARPAREVYEARHSSNSNAQHLADSINNMRQQQEELQNAAAFIAEEKDKDFKPPLSREAYEANLNANL